MKWELTGNASGKTGNSHFFVIREIQIPRSISLKLLERLIVVPVLFYRVPTKNRARGNSKWSMGRYYGQLEMKHYRKLEYLPPAALRPWERNARTHSKKQLKQIAKSIETFGFTNPVLIDRDNVILAGHGRVEAAKLLGLDSVPCIRLEHMTPEEKRAYVLADNKLALNAGWDEDLVGAGA
jgi:hypothetical protein